MALTDGARVLVTGGCGFIGVNLAAALLERGCDLLAFDDFSTGRRPDGEGAGYRVIEGDIRDEEAVREAAAGADHIVHLAAHTDVVGSLADPRLDAAVNVEGTFNVLLAARDLEIASVVFASSNAPLGDAEAPSHEGRVPRPRSPYGASKLAGEALCSAFSGSYGLSTVSLRFSNVYGPFSYHKGSVVATFMKRLMAFQPLVVYGDGTQTRDFLYVDDLVSGVVQALGHEGSGEVFHLGTGRETSINDLVELVGKVFPKQEVVVEHRPLRPGEVMRSYSDISEAREALGFEPKVTLEEGLERTARWFEHARLMD